MSSLLPVEIPQNSMDGQQRQQISELQFDKILNTFNVSMLEDKIQNPSKFFFRFSLGGNVMDQGSGDGRFGGRIKILAINCWKEFSKFLDVRRALSKIIQNSHFKKQGWSRGTESPERGPVSTRMTDCFHDLRLLSSYWRS